MFRKDPLFIPGWIYFFLMFPLASRLPESFGCENGIIENLQMFWLFGGLILCSAALDHRFQDWGGRPYTLWKAGILYYFLLIMREISWGRTFFPTASGGFISYSEMGLYGKMVHPMVGILLAVLLVLLYRAKVWQVPSQSVAGTQNHKDPHHLLDPASPLYRVLLGRRAHRLLSFQRRAG